LTAAGSAAAMAGSILALALPKALAAAGPIGMIAGLGLGLFASMLPDPKKIRDQQETDTLNAARYTAPTQGNYTVDRYGRAIDTDMAGGVRISVQMDVSAIDSQSFMDRSPQVVDMLAGALEGRVSPRLAAAVRNTVRAQ
jgi:hypothetical protein